MDGKEGEGSATEAGNLDSGYEPTYKARTLLSPAPSPSAPPVPHDRWWTPLLAFGAEVREAAGRGCSPAMRSPAATGLRVPQRAWVGK